jgi:hypothetical protein
MENAALAGTFGVVVSCASGGAYIHSILKRRTRPHVFTQLIWTIVTGIAAAAQWSHGGGARYMKKRRMTRRIFFCRIGF